MTNTHRLDPGLDVLLRMREFFADPSNRCVGVYSNKEKRCLMGYYMDLKGRAATTANATELFTYGEEICVLLGFSANDAASLFMLNDKGTDGEILARIDRAIADRTAELSTKVEA